MSPDILIEAEIPNSLAGLNDDELVVVDQLFTQSNEESVTISINEFLHERVPKTITARTREELADAICALPNGKRRIIVQRLGSIVIQQMAQMQHSLEG